MCIVYNGVKYKGYFVEQTQFIFKIQNFWY